MEGNPNENIGLPEIYLSPSKNLHRKTLKNKEYTWEDNEINTVMVEDDDAPNSHVNSATKHSLDLKPIVRKHQKHLSTKGMRGETPGSDSPVNLPPPLGGTGSKNNFVVSVESPEANVSDSESDSFVWTLKSENGNYSQLGSFQRRPVEGADSNGEVPSTSQQSSILANDLQEIKFMQRNSPAGISTPEMLSNTTSTDIEGASSIHDPVSDLVRPPALGQSEDVFQIFTRKDLGSTDGEDSSNESIKQLQGKSVTKTFVEGCSIGSQSENTDSTNTVLDMKREPVQGCEDRKMIAKPNNNLSKPNFIVGGAISPRFVVDQKGCMIDLERSLISEADRNQCRSVSSHILVPEQNDSLTSMISVDSTQHPESSECITSPSLISISSVASSKKLEWDSGADVGYSGKVYKQMLLTSSLSTLERIAIGNYASVLRAEPEGKGTNQLGIKGRGSKKGTSNSIQKENKMSKFSELKSHSSNKKFSNKDYYSLNCCEKETALVNYRISPSSDDECMNAGVSNSPKKKGKKGSLHINKKTSNEAPQSYGSWVGYKNSRRNLGIHSKEKTSSLSDLRCSAKGEEFAQNIDTDNTETILTDHALQAKWSQTNPLDSNTCINSSSLINSTLSLPLYKTSLEKGSRKSDKNLHQSQSLEFEKEKCENMSDRELQNLALPQFHNKSQKDLCSKEDDSKINLVQNYFDKSKTSSESIENECDQNILNTESESNVDKSSESVSMSSVNVFLLSLAKKLKIYVDNLMEAGAVDKLEDYNKLQDYIDFVGMPSDTDEEIKLKQSVADIILRMFGDINAQEIELSSSTLNTEEMISEVNLSHSSSISSNGNLESKTINKGGETGKDSSKEAHHCYVLSKENCSSLKGSFVCVPYRPPSATRTYYIAAVEENKEIGLMGESQSKLYNAENCLSNREEESGSSSKVNNGSLNYEEEKEHCSTEFFSFDEERKTEQPSVGDKNENSESSEKWFEGTQNKVPSMSKGLYQDWHGTYHIAHHPPGYSSCMDSHQSESTSDSETRKSDTYQSQELNESSQGLLNSEAARANLPPAWTSTGSESAYETIRERHRNVGESLASSFEFYSTSPRDARLLGYISNDSKKAEENSKFRAERSGASFYHRVPKLDDDRIPSYKSSERDDPSSSSYPASSYASRKAVKKTQKKNKDQKKYQNFSHSSQTESEGASSSVSVVQIQKRRYVRRITKYINTLERLERVLMPSCESLFSAENEELHFPKRKPKKKMERKTELMSEYSSSNGNNFVSSEYDLNSSSKFSMDGDGNSLIIHGTSSLQRKSEKKSEHPRFLPQSSSDERPKQTSTLRKESKWTKELKENEIRNEKDDIEGLGQISDFKKLMASRNVGGETRPYRFLLKRTETRGFSVAENGGLESKLNVEIDADHQTESIKPSKERDSVEKLHSKDPRENSLEEYHSETISSEEFDSNALHFRSSNKESKEKKQHCAGLKEDLSNVEGHSPFSVINDEVYSHKNLKLKEMREFGQMFPSDSFLNAAEKQCSSISTQTGHSLLQPKSNDATEIESEKQNNLETNSGGSSTIDRFSSLEEMDARIKYNAEKINSALALYNKKFPLPVRRPDSRLGVSLGKSFHKEPNTNLTKERNTKLNEESNINLTNHHASTSIVSPPLSSGDVKPKESKAVEINRMEVNEADEMKKEDISRTKDTVILSKSKKSLKFTVGISDRNTNRNIQTKSLIDELIELNKENEIMSLQEALSLAKPTYVKEAERRRLKICKKQAVRHNIQTHNQNILAELPDNLKTPTVIRKFLFKCDESPLFTYKTIRKQNQRLYQMLPEAQNPTIHKRKTGMAKTNRIMANFYSQKLQHKTLKGKVSHTHEEVVTPAR